MVALALAAICPGCIGDAVNSAVAQVRSGVINADANTQALLDLYQEEMLANADGVRQAWYNGVIAAAKANKLDDPAVLAGVEKRYQDYEAAKAAKLAKISKLRTATSTNTAGTLRAADLAVKAGYSMGTKADIDARLDRMQALLEQAITAGSRTTSKPRRRRRRRRSSTPSAPPSDSESAAAIQEAIVGRAMAIAASTLDADPAAAFFGEFDKALERFRAKRDLVFAAIDVNSPEFQAMVTTVDSCVTVWEGLGMVADKILAMAEKYAPLLLA